MSSATGSAKPPPRRDAIMDGDPITVPSLSASVILIAPLRTRTLDGYDYRILLLQRNGKSSTFNSAHVFPGGNIDAGDSLKEWDSLYPEKKLSADESRLRAIKICAVRETFEESGVLLSECTSQGSAKAKWAGIDEANRKIWRDKVHSNGSSFIDLFRFLRGNDSQSTLRPALSTLQYRANWITPRNMKRRFDTHFFVTILPPSFQLDADLPTSSSSTTSGASSVISKTIGSSDGKETVSADWVTPAEAITLTLAKEEGKQMILFPPQFYILAELVGIKSWKELVDEKDCDVEGAPKIKSRLVSAFEPQMKAVHNLSGDLRAATVLPGDPAHSETARLFPSATGKERHRTYVILPAKPSKDDEKWKAKAPLGLTVLGLHRSGVEDLIGEGWADMIEGDAGAEGEGGNKIESKL